MTATDELRRLLDERGVEWWEDAFASEHRTVFDGKDGVRYCVYQLGFELFICSILPVTPEQAIEATLGRGECRNKATSPLTFWCDQCDCAAEGWVDVGGTLINGFRYCPWCGRKVRA